jgi:hypothetical protein
LSGSDPLKDTAMLPRLQSLAAELQGLVYSMKPE